MGPRVLGWMQHDAAGLKLPSGFAEVPHMGTALTGSSPSWTEAAAQLARRVNWDLGAEPVEFRALDSVAGSCDRALTLGQLGDRVEASRRARAVTSQRSC